MDTIKIEPYEILKRFEFDPVTGTSKLAGAHFKARTVGIVSGEIVVNSEGPAQNPALLTGAMKDAFDAAEGNNAAYMARAGDLELEVANLKAALSAATQDAASARASKDADAELIGALRADFGRAKAILEAANEAMNALITTVQSSAPYAYKAKAAQNAVAALSEFVKLSENPEWKHTK
jgi:hypothetical protein